MFLEYYTQFLIFENAPQDRILLYYTSLAVDDDISIVYIHSRDMFSM